jgi:hypothetical protein
MAIEILAEMTRVRYRSQEPLALTGSVRMLGRNE